MSPPMNTALTARPTGLNARITQAYCLPTGTRFIPPFDDLPRDVQVLGRSLTAYQDEMLAEVGLRRVSEPPEGPHVVFSDRTWFTDGAVRRMLAQLQPGQRLRVDCAAFWELTGGLQELDQDGVYELGIAGSPIASFDELVPGVVDFEFTLSAPSKQHSAIAHALPAEVATSDACVHQIDHWVHILRINWLAMAATIEREKRRFASEGVLTKASKLAGVLWRSKGLTRDKIAAGLSQIGPDCQIHSSAVVEASVIGRGVQIGPMAVVRGAVIGDGAQIEEHAICNASVLGKNTRLGRRGMLNLAVLYDGAFVSNGRGFQACVFGKDSFVAETVMAYDLSFGSPVKVWHRGERVSSGTHFLGAAIGHRARVGAEVILGYGAEVPNEAFLVGPAHNVLRSWGGGAGPHRVEDGVARSCAPAPKSTDPSEKA
ncbi:MAG: acetyltransferase-like isoleucine patch superfamily enzyme [Cognaticolwellia sp.]